MNYPVNMVDPDGRQPSCEPCLLAAQRVVGPISVKVKSAANSPLNKIDAAAKSVVNVVVDNAGPGLDAIGTSSDVLETAGQASPANTKLLEIGKAAARVGGVATSAEIFSDLAKTDFHDTAKKNTLIENTVENAVEEAPVVGPVLK